MHCIVMCTSLWQILTGGETKMFYCREDLSERGVDTELCKPLKLWWRSEELIRTEWTIQTRRTQSVMQKVSPRMTPLTRITGWVYKISGGSKTVFLSPFNPIYLSLPHYWQVRAKKLVRTSWLLSALTESTSNEGHKISLCGSNTSGHKVDSYL